MIFYIFDSIMEIECKPIINLVEILISPLEFFYMRCQMHIHETYWSLVYFQSNSNSTFVPLQKINMHFNQFSEIGRKSAVVLWMPKRKETTPAIDCIYYLSYHSSKQPSPNLFRHNIPKLIFDFILNKNHQHHTNQSYQLHLGIFGTRM